PVPAGTDGAVSWLGTLAGLVAAWLVCGVAVSTGLIGGGRTGIVLAAAFVGSTADSMLGATLEARGLIDNEAVNLSNTLVGSFPGAGPGEEDRMIARARQGDREAFDRLVESHLAHVWAVVWRIVRHREDAEDVVQEVFLAAFQGLPGYRGESRLSTWLHRIAV